MPSRSSFTSSLIGAVITCGVLAGCAEDHTQLPPRYLTKDVAIAPGAECPFGGVQTSSGYDSNGNAALDPGEVTQTSDVCAAQPIGPVPTLTRTDSEPPGHNCFHGGTAIRSGLDEDRDGVLEDVEVIATTYACTASDLFDGDFTSAMWRDPAAVQALSEARVITGSLTVDHDAAVALPALEQVTGSLTVVHAGAPGGFAAPALALVGRDLVVGTDVGLASELALPALSHVGGALTLTDDTLPGFRAPLLAHVGGDVVMRGAAIATLALPSLRSVGSMVLTDLAVPILELPALNTVLGELALARLNSLSLLDLSALRSIGEDLTILTMPALPALDLPLLGEAGSMYLTLDRARSLQLPTLSVVTGNLWILDSPALQAATLPALTTVAGSLIVERCTDFYRLDAPVLDSVAERGDGVGDFAVLFSGWNLHAVSLPRLRSAPGGVLVDQTALGQLELPALTEASRLQITGNPGLHIVRLPGLRAIDAAVIDSPVLTELALGGVASVSQRLEIRNTQLVDLRGLAGLRAIGAGRSAANLVLDGNAALTSLAGLEQLGAITGKLALTNDAKLASLAGLAGLTTVGGTVTVTGDPALSPDEIAAFIARVHP